MILSYALIGSLLGLSAGGWLLWFAWEQWRWEPITRQIIALCIGTALIGGIATALAAGWVVERWWPAEPGSVFFVAMPCLA